MGITIDKPFLFKEALKTKINLFTGAGFSKLPDSFGNVLPDALDLCEEICARFSISSTYDTDLERLSNILNLRVKDDFQKYLRAKYTVETYNPLYEELNRVSVNSFITTNIDNLIQCVMDNSSKYYLHNILRDGANKRSRIAVPYITLHGDVKNISSHMYFGKNELANVDNDNRELFNTMHAKLLEAPTLFWGYGFHDNAIERYIVKVLEERHQNIWIQCRPGSDNIQYFRDLGCYVIEALTDDLLLWIKDNINYTENTENADVLAELSSYYLPSINQLEVVSQNDYFVNGNTHWYCILSRFPYETKKVNDLYELSLEHKNCLAIGIPFSGKTTLMMQLAAKMQNDVKLVINNLNYSQAKYIGNKLAGVSATIFIDDCCDDIEGIKYLMAQPNTKVVGFCDDFAFESSKHIIDGIPYKKVYFSELDVDEAQRIYQAIPLAIQADIFRYKEKNNEKFSMLEMMSKNVKGVITKERIDGVLRKVKNSSCESFEVIALTAYLASNKSAISTDVLISYFETSDYNIIKNIVDVSRGYLAELNLDLHPDAIDQDYFDMRSNLFAYHALKSLTTSYKADFCRVIRKFILNVAPVKVYKHYVFKRTGYDALMFFRLFDDSAHDLYSKIYDYDSSPYSLQQWALYKAYLGDYKGAFADIDRAINLHSNNFSMKNTRAIILFEANRDKKSDLAMEGMSEAMETLNQCYHSDKRKVYHAKKYAEFSMFLATEWQETGYLSQAKEWLENIVASGESTSHSTKKLLKDIKSIIG